MLFFINIYDIVNLYYFVRAVRVLKKIEDQKSGLLDNVSGGTKYHNVCQKCGKEWDSPEFNPEKDAMPNWYTGPWCPSCRKLMSETQGNNAEKIDN